MLPELHPHAERFVRSAREEVLDDPDLIPLPHGQIERCQAVASLIGEYRRDAWQSR